MIEGLSVLLLAAHLVCVNVGSAGPLVCIAYEWRSPHDPLAGVVGRFLAWCACAMLVAGGLLGLALGALLWDAEFVEVLQKFPSKVRDGVWEFFFSLVLMLLAAAWWTWRPASGLAARATRSLLQLLAGTNLLYHFPVLFLVLSDVAGGHLVVEGPVPGSEFRRFLADSGLWSRVIHVWIASFALCGATVMSFGWWKSGSGALRSAGSRVIAGGARLALLATVLQIPSGIWLLARLPARAQQQVLGGDSAAVLLFGVSVLVAIWLLHRLAALAWGEFRRGDVPLSVGGMLLGVGLMTGALVRASG